ncbi:MAG: amidohydrolase family protein [Nostocoides sp.]
MTGLRLTGRLVADGQVLPEAAVVIVGGTIAYAGQARDLPAHLAAAPVPDHWRDGLTMLPGLVDVHCHGAAGGEFGESAEDGARAAAHHQSCGTTTVVASIASRVPDRLLSAVDACASLVRSGVVGGLHLEGPFLSTARRGAQNPAALRDVDPALVSALIEAAGAGALVQMTHAPERDPHGLLPALLSDSEVVTAVGHTDADALLTSRALAAAADVAPRGLRPLVTHLFNGMPPLHHRSPGPVAAALTAAARGDAVLELIGDGVHLAPETVRMVFETVGPDNIALVSDAMGACGMADGTYHLGDLEVRVAHGVARLAEGDSIAGGTATLLEVVRWCVTVAGVNLADAVTAATATPAGALSLPAGTLRPGDRADVVVVDDALERVAVLRAGVRIS